MSEGWGNFKLAAFFQHFLTLHAQTLFLSKYRVEQPNLRETFCILFQQNEKWELFKQIKKTVFGGFGNWRFNYVQNRKYKESSDISEFIIPGSLTLSLFLCGERSQGDNMQQSLDRINVAQNTRRKFCLENWKYCRKKELNRRNFLLTFILVFFSHFEFSQIINNGVIPGLSNKSWKDLKKQKTTALI